MEIWKNIPWFEWKYQVSDLWNIKTLHDRWWKERLLKPAKCKNWYLTIVLVNEWKKTFYIHRLVLLSFKWESDLHCNHKNWIRTDNRIDNLEWVTRSENEIHKNRVLGFVNPQQGKFWKSNHNSKKVIQYTNNWIYIKVWDSFQDIKRNLGFNHSNVISCCKWRNKTAYWFIWKYK